MLLVNLAKGKLGEDTAALLGSLLVSRIGLAALSRADVPESERRDFYLYLDEFQNFSTLSLATMLPKLRKYHVGLMLAHQHLAQLDPLVREAILGNVGTTAAFRMGASDAAMLVARISARGDDRGSGEPAQLLHLRQSSWPATPRRARSVP